MKFHLETALLITILQRLLNITDKRTTLPVLSNVLMKTVGQDAIEFSATDLEISFRTEALAQVEIFGMTTVSARKLLEVVRELPHQNIFLEATTSHRLLIHAGRSKFELQTIPAEDFPHITFQEQSEFTACDVDLLRKSLGKIFYGIPAEEDHFNIAGLYWHAIEPDHYRFVSCDGHRLAYTQLPKASFPDLQLNRGLIIPRKGVQEMVRFLDKESEAFLAVSENSLVLKTTKSILSIQLLESELPDYELIIPVERPSSFRVDRDVLSAAVKRVAVLTNHRWRHVKFIIRENVLELEAGNPDVGSANDLIDIEYQGADFTVAFNVRYVLDTLQSIEGQTMIFEWLDDEHGGIFLGLDDPNYFSLIMPMIVGS
jgi:DNA polymerase III subunit beta